MPCGDSAQCGVLEKQENVKWIVEHSRREREEGKRVVRNRYSKHLTTSSAKTQTTQSRHVQSAISDLIKIFKKPLQPLKFFFRGLIEIANFLNFSLEKKNFFFIWNSASCESWIKLYTSKPNLIHPNLFCLFVRETEVQHFTYLNLGKGLLWSIVFLIWIPESIIKFIYSVICFNSWWGRVEQIIQNSG